MRKEKVLLVNQQKPDIENTISDATLQGTLLRGMEDKSGYLCPRCKKRYSDEDKLKAHLASHGKVLFHLLLLIAYNWNGNKNIFKQ